ncbi:hypothetical protein ACLI1C_02495 [Devosia sp. XGJD_8]|jgi:hypothetical protein|uniref:hypothetical protein n=1 Tax=Devosia sp. XGJD_8 TaxID=3391187 RepID=UPI00398540FE
MQVNVFISRPVDAEAPTLLVLPFGPTAALPRHLQGIVWDYLATTSTEDKLIGAAATAVEEGLARDGFALVAPTG